MKPSRIVLLLILLLGLGLRVGWALLQSSDDAAIDRLPDQREYLSAGRHILDGQGLVISDPRFEQSVYAYRTPGYPAFVAMCGGKIIVIRLAQAIVDVSTIFGIYLLARRWMCEGRSNVAAALVAMNPFLIFFCGLILSETLFTSMLVWGMVMLVRSDGPWPAERAKFWMWIGGGVMLALAILVRPGAIALPVILGAAAALVNRQIVLGARRTFPLPVMAVFLILTLAVLFPWAARNRVTLHVNSWIWTSTNDGITRYDGFNPDATGASDQRFVNSMRWLSGMTEVGRSRYLTTLADEWIVDHPSDAAWLGLVKAGRTWSPIPLSSAYGTRLLYRIAGLGFAGPLYLLMLIGLWRGSLPRPVKRYCLLPALYFTLAAAVSVGSLRYLVPAQAPMAILAAGAFAMTARKSTGSSDKNGVYAGQSGSTL